MVVVKVVVTAAAAAALLLRSRYRGASRVSHAAPRAAAMPGCQCAPSRRASSCCGVVPDKVFDAFLACAVGPSPTGGDAAADSTAEGEASSEKEQACRAWRCVRDGRSTYVTDDGFASINVDATMLVFERV